MLPDPGNPQTGLPPGQFAAHAFVRFGLGRFRNKALPADPASSLRVGGDVARPMSVMDQFPALPRHSQVSDFHCVTTWSLGGLAWSGVRFVDFYRELVVAQAQPVPGAELVVFRGRDGYCSALPLADLLADDVLLADRLDDAPLGVAHGAPLRLIAPAHYGYKNVKYLNAIEFWTNRRAYRFPWPYPQFMDHHRARVAFEERASAVPNWVLRWVYRLFIPKEVRGE